MLIQWFVSSTANSLVLAGMNSLIMQQDEETPDLTKIELNSVRMWSSMRYPLDTATYEPLLCKIPLATLAC